jgi:hypothetical protein
MRVLRLKARSSKYPNQVLIWANELAQLRNGQFDVVSWTDSYGNLIFEEIPVNLILNLVNRYAGKLYNFRRTYFVALPYEGFTSIQEDSSVRQHLSERIKSNKTPGVEYQLVKLHEKIRIMRYGLTKSGLLSKSFDTTRQAKNYISSQLKEGTHA